jgi:hypothetical protein
LRDMRPFELVGIFTQMINNFYSKEVLETVILHKHAPQVASLGLVCWLLHRILFIL